MTELLQTEIGELEPIKALAYLGPKRTFTHQAALAMLQQPGYEGYILREAQTIGEICKRVASRQISRGIVPIENSTGGPVKDTHQAFIDEGNLQIVGELGLPIHQTIYFQDRSKVKTVASKDQGLLQCAGGINNTFPHAELLAMSSTGAAVAKAAEDPTVAGIGSSIAGEEYADLLQRLDYFEDNKNNTTTFVVIQPKDEISPPTGRDKTTIIVDVPDISGGLYQTLKQFSDKGINLTKIKSLQRADGNVAFLVTVDGHTTDEPVQDALSTLDKKGIRIKNMGSYQKAEYEPPNNQGSPDMKYAVSMIQKEAQGENGIKPNEAVIVFSLPNEKGALVNALKPFANAGVNLTKIDSLPSGNYGQYIFYLAFKNHLENQQNLIDQVAIVCQNVVLLNIPYEETTKGGKK